MVRRDEDGRRSPKAAEAPSSRCTSPAGASPVPVSAGAPGSRPPPSGRDPVGEAGRRKPLRREQERGPQHQVKPAASTDPQWGSRAAHVTAKATSTRYETGCLVGSPGVEGAARVQGEVRNTGDPSALPSSRRGGSYKPKAKSSAAQRESEGTNTPTMGVTNNAPGGRGPCGGRVGDAAIAAQLEQKRREAPRTAFDRACTAVSLELELCLSQGLTTWSEIAPRLRGLALAGAR